MLHDLLGPRIVRAEELGWFGDWWGVMLACGCEANVLARPTLPCRVQKPRTCSTHSRDALYGALGLVG